ncbi:plastocyanin/azurin family copper-binding protein [Haladaptatus caseinilyticus]|uniref:plastocyanin/azurin family copper-binding protein n=1 Tax=Haladaptatus caseinilyticus TaxID=2993314 RepID=UPI00224ABA61|nr:plastocyanin/azurin family copper-binding protein [Haladaptatus caseinilyticus]
MNRRAFLAGIVGSASVTLAGCAGIMDTGRNTSQGDFDVGMGSNAFHPRELEVTPGTTVVWKNTGMRRHTVTAYGNGGIPKGAEYFASGGYDSEQAARDAWQSGYGGSIDQGTTYEHTFEVPGSYSYFCVPHEPSGMSGSIVVTE